LTDIPTLPVVDDSDLTHIKKLGEFKHVSLVDSKSARLYVRKSIDPDQAEGLKVWENEFVNLSRLQKSLYIVDLVGMVTSRNPYSPHREDVVTAFLLEYGHRGTLKQFVVAKRDQVTELDKRTSLKWMLQVAQGLRDMHAEGIIHGDLTPENVIIMDGQAKIIDLAQSGYTAPYHAPEFPAVFETRCTKKFHMCNTSERVELFCLLAKLLYYLSSGKSHVGYLFNYDENPIHQIVCPHAINSQC
jgi:serine/threonine protein kinase